MPAADVVTVLWVPILAVAVLMPVGWIASGLIAARRRSGAPRSSSAALPPNWRWTLSSALLYALAFNLVFLVQEFFLVWPKALTPGLQPTLYHNNHTWTGTSALAPLLQGTGALATAVSAVACAVALCRYKGRSANVVLFLVWMTYCGAFQALSQVVIGSINSANDVGMAMDYLGMTAAARSAAGLAALAAVPLVALWLVPFLQSLAGSAASRRHRVDMPRFVFFIAALPGMLALPLIAAFRVPREFVEVMIAPLVVTFVGIAWMQAGAGRISTPFPQSDIEPPSVWIPLAAVLMLLAIFQSVLRRGVPFY
jgi:hypothetical protein